MITLLIVIDAALIGMQVEMNPEVYYNTIQTARIVDQVCIINVILHSFNCNN